MALRKKGNPIINYSNFRAYSRKKFPDSITDSINVEQENKTGDSYYTNSIPDGPYTINISGTTYRFTLPGGVFLTDVRFSVTYGGTDWSYAVYIDNKQVDSGGGANPITIPDLNDLEYIKPQTLTVLIVKNSGSASNTVTLQLKGFYL